MKICLINNLYKPYARGGAERVVEILSEEALSLGHDCFVITTRPYFKRDRAGEDRSGDTRYLPSFYHSLPRWPKPLRFFYHLLSLADFISAARVKKILKREKCAVVISNNLTGLGGEVALAVKQSGVKHIHILHDIQLLHPSGLMYLGKESLIDSFPARAYQFFSRRFFRRCDRVISPSRWLLKLHKQRGFFHRAQSEVRLNPIGGQSGLVRPAEPGTRPFTFLYVGQLAEHKGVMTLREAFFNLRRRLRGAKIKLEIAGRGPLYKNLNSSSTDGLKYLGGLDNKKVLEKMAAADCLVAPSLCYENSPSVVYEAVSRGLPFIGSDIGGLAELTEMFGGLKFKANDTLDLEKKMQWALDNAPALKNRALAEKEKFDHRQMAAAQKYLRAVL